MNVTAHADPAAVPCTVNPESDAGPPFTVDGIPCAQAGTLLLIRLGILARWQPVSTLDTAPFAFVALGIYVHAAWFRTDRLVSLYELTACGQEFHALREPLLARPIAACAVGPCLNCLTVWNTRYA